ncbi:MAG: hypothetical protein DI568_13930 [Sphingomonas sp.]|nr:MAG: hypothetical protein DI568_13930 [Sphingomonas sp.]
MVLATTLVWQLPAQAETDACKTISDANLPPAFAAWGQPAAAVTAGASGKAATRIEPNKAAEVTLLPAITPVLAPEQARTPANAHAGLLKVRIPTAGNWRVAISNPAWLDVIGADGKAVKSVAHGHMAPCTTLKKAVEFPLSAGDYLIQLSGNPGSSVKLLVSPKP